MPDGASVKFDKASQTIKLQRETATAMLMIENLQGVRCSKNDSACYYETLTEKLEKYPEQLQLVPGKRRICAFHSARPHYLGEYGQDQLLFEELGGIVWQDTCTKGKWIRWTPFADDTVYCICEAPPSKFFGRKFMEIGAMDGVHYSNTLFFESQMNWTGLCIEGSQKAFALLKQNRPNCVSVNAVPGFNKKPWRIKEEEPNETSYFYSFDQPKFADESVFGELGKSCMEGFGICGSVGSLQKVGDYTRSQVQIRKMQDLMYHNRFEKEMMFISIDVQGAEMQVLRTIMFDRLNGNAKHPGTLIVVLANSNFQKAEHLMQKIRDFMTYYKFQKILKTENHSWYKRFFEVARSEATNAIMSRSLPGSNFDYAACNGSLTSRSCLRSPASLQVLNATCLESAQRSFKARRGNWLRRGEGLKRSADGQNCDNLWSNWLAQSEHEIGMFLDIGANKGETTEHFAQLFPDVTIYSFEAHPFTARELEARFKQQSRVHIINSAVSDQPGELEVWGRGKKIAKSSGDTAVTVGRATERNGMLIAKVPSISITDFVNERLPSKQQMHMV
eukprot:gnl/MRDRNA2_/MRDRNA2_30244_c0_seq1.p1 gnl/MRDRNA2_/MRDRNA2_30244_c0~~gnl/MRDRNA2_/MRDRNA2_30244_c0_seq1.p1  ORF type:complete len:593 (-),score=82.98 gnl/MRDRNA2_/MRDRNA2_30244_c0_seq1:1255-2937(-)